MGIRIIDVEEVTLDMIAKEAVPPFMAEFMQARQKFKKRYEELEKEVEMDVENEKRRID